MTASKRGMMVGPLPNPAKYYSPPTTSTSPQPASNLATDEPSELWVSNSVHPTDTTITGNIPALDIDAVCLGNHNLGYDTGKYRVITSSSSGVSNVYLSPDSTVATSNSTSVYTDIDEDPLAPDGSWATPTTPGSAWGMTVGFPTPSSTLAVGDTYQCFIIWLRKVNSVSTTDRPSIVVEVSESAVVKHTFAAKPVTVTGGQFILAQWDASVLGNPAGANVQLKFTCTPEFFGDHVEVGAVQWLYQTQTEVDAMLYDSGWLSIPQPVGDSLWGGTSALDVNVASGGTSFASRKRNDSAEVKDITHPLPSTVSNVDYVQLFIIDDHTEPYGAGGAPFEEPPQFTSAGIFSYGAMFTPTRDKVSGWTVQIKHTNRGSNTEGGQSYGTSAFKVKTIACSLRGLTRAEGVSLLDRLDLRTGTQGAFWVIMEPDQDQDNRAYASMWCTTVSSPLTFGPFRGESNVSLTDKSLTFREKL